MSENMMSTDSRIVKLLGQCTPSDKESSGPDDGWFLQPEDAGQVVPALDLWLGRHELLYSRIFNS
jgi:urease accessory protein UreF